MSHRGSPHPSVLLLLVLLCLGTTSHAQNPDPPSFESVNGSFPPDDRSEPAVETNGKQLVTMNFQEVDIAVLARFISEITHKNFIVDETVKGAVTIITPTHVTPDEAYTIFQSVLQVKGFTTVSSGGVIKIVPSRAAKQTGVPILSNGALPQAGDEFITRLVPLNYVTASDMAPVLQPMVSPDGLLIPYPQTNALILTDLAPNVRRLLGVLDELDVEGYERTTEVIPLTHAFAADLAKHIEAMMKEQEDTSRSAKTPRIRTVSTAGTASGGSAALSSKLQRPVQVLPDERTNSLIVMSGPLELKTIRHLVAQLDVPLPPETNKINVYPLKHANAEEMLPVLADLIGAPSGGRESRYALNTSYREGRTRRHGRSRSSSHRFGSARRGQPVSSTSPASPLPTIPGVSGKAAEFRNEVTIAADPATNALIISAAPQDFTTLKQVIEQLDVRRRQVYVEAILLEVSVDRIRELGIELQGAFSIEGEGVGFGRSNLGTLNTALTDPAALSGLLLAAASNQTIELPDGTRIPAKIALLRAAQGSNDINVLSAPTLLTTDNEEAEIVVGQNVPFVASRATDSSDLDNLFATVQREDVGITLRLTPQISEGQHVRLDIYEEVSAIVPPSPAVGDPDLVGPTTSVRSASTTVVVRDGQTVVIGGLISDNTVRQHDSVPYLGEVPVLGNLFRSDANTTEKINLLIFLTPRIVRDETEIAQYSLNERERFRSFLREHEAPSRWEEQLDRPSFEFPVDSHNGGVLLPAVGDNS